MSEIPSQIGPYTIDREVGRGGMGVVYLGHDTRLDRAVAIKALPEHLAQDPDRLARFEREAKTLASLNHPNVAGIFGIESMDSARYLILEYVEGETLADRLERGAIPTDDALDIAVQIAQGVEAAHEAGIIHRDLKPANIKITPDDRVKVLDFGLAKSSDAQTATSSSTNIPTVTSPAFLTSPTIPGAIMGTAPYMSPEQARGRSVNKRTDIWSFGVILYEMLSGVSPFHGETVTDSIGAILHKDPDRALLPRDTPRAVHRVLERCLERDKNKRLRDIGDARIELERAEQAPGDRAESGARNAASPLLLLLVALLFAAIGAGAMLLTKAPPQPQQAVLATIMPPEDNLLVYMGDLAGPAAITRDGRRIAFAAKKQGEQQQLFIRDLDSNIAEPVRGAEGAIFPFWSWDGNTLAYFALGELRAYDTQTGTNRTICAAPGARGGAWLADGTIVFSPSFQSPIHRVASTGGEPTPITSIDPLRHTSHRWPSPTRDGRNFIYIAVSHDQGRLDECTIYLATPPGQPDTEVTRARFGAQIVGDQLLVVRNNTLTATPFDSATGKLTGAATPILTNVASDLSTWNAPFCASETGVILFHEQTNSPYSIVRAGAAASLGENLYTQLVLRDGRVSNILAEGVPQNSLSLSPDDLTLAISGRPGSAITGNSFDIWLYNTPGGSSNNRAETDPQVPGIRSADTQARLSEPPRRLTFLSGAEVCPIWSPDGEWLAFGSLAPSGTGETHKLYKVRVSGGSPIQLLETPNGFENGVWPTDWTDDGRYIIYVNGSWVASGNGDIYALDLETNESVPLVTGEGDQYNAEVSPDGKWIVYTSNETGISEVYVVPFPPGWETERAQGNPAPASNAKWRVSIAGAGKGRWSPDGDELYYIARSNSMIAVPVRTEGTDFIHSAGTPIFQMKYDVSVDFDVSTNWDGFAINGNDKETDAPISILTNWRTRLDL